MPLGKAGCCPGISRLLIEIDGFSDGALVLEKSGAGRL